MSNSIESYLDISFNKTNVTSTLNNDLEKWTHVDNLSGEIDDMQVTLDNSSGKWLNSWFPNKGTLIEAELHKKNFLNNSHIKSYLGKFEIDEIEFSSYPSTVTIKALSVPLSASLRGEIKTKTWEKTTVKLIAQSIAKASGLKLIYQAESTEKKDVIEQDNKTDLSFLYQICNDEGLCLKISNTSIIILDEEDYESKATVLDISAINKDVNRGVYVLNWNARNTVNGIFKACRVESTDSSNKIKATFTPSPAIKVGTTLVVKTSVKTTAEAKKLARKRLREKNKNATTVQMSVIGNFCFDAGMTVNLKYFGQLNGKYIITKVTNNQSNAQLSLRRCLVGY